MNIFFNYVNHNRGTLEDIFEELEAKYLHKNYIKENFPEFYQQRESYGYIKGTTICLLSYPGIVNDLLC
jgi:hypothetical protein